MQCLVLYLILKFYSLKGNLVIKCSVFLNILKDTWYVYPNHISDLAFLINKHCGKILLSVYFDFGYVCF